MPTIAIPQIVTIITYMRLSLCDTSSAVTYLAIANNQYYYYRSRFDLYVSFDKRKTERESPAYSHSHSKKSGSHSNANANRRAIRVWFAFVPALAACVECTSVRIRDFDFAKIDVSPPNGVKSTHYQVRIPAAGPPCRLNTQEQPFRLRVTRGPEPHSSPAKTESEGPQR